MCSERVVSQPSVRLNMIKYVYFLYDGRAETQSYDECSIYEICESRKQARQRARAWDDAVVVRYVDPPDGQPITGEGERMYQLEYRP